jgi:23S rRNA pseudouridine1911/1915/1917 synthase
MVTLMPHRTTRPFTRQRGDHVPREISEPIRRKTLDDAGASRRASSHRVVVRSSDVVYFDRDVVVVRKPAHLSTVPFHAGEKDTLVDQVRTLVRRIQKAKSDLPASRRYDPMLGVVQRLDKETTGLLVFARNLAAKKHLQAQFRAHTIERRYQALVHGHMRDAHIKTTLVPNRGDGLRGSWGHFRRHRGAPPRDAEPAETFIKVLAHLVAVGAAQGTREQASLIQCRLKTGRQHQIRIHASEQGHPLLGERVYIRDYPRSRIAAPRVMLHACLLGFVHPRTGEYLEFTQPLPDDFQAMVAKFQPVGDATHTEGPRHES